MEGTLCILLSETVRTGKRERVRISRAKAHQTESETTSKSELGSG